MHSIVIYKQARCVFVTKKEKRKNLKERSSDDNFEKKNS